MFAAAESDGEEWHLAGKGQTKPNTWRDFIACAQYLIDNKYTSPPRPRGLGHERWWHSDWPCYHRAA